MLMLAMPQSLPPWLRKGLEGLGEVVDAAGGEAADLVVGIAEAGEEDDGDLAEGGVGLEPGADLVAVHAGHVDVEEDEVGRDAGGGGEGLGAAGDGGDGVAGLVELFAEEEAVFGDVVNDEDVGGRPAALWRGHGQFWLARAQTVRTRPYLLYHANGLVSMFLPPTHT